MIVRDSNYYKAARLCLWLFLSFIFVSFLYVIITKTYNGDFIGVPVKISTGLLIVNLLLSIIPFIITWYIYRFFKCIKVKHYVSIPIKFWGQFMVLLIIWNVIITLVYGVGVMGAPMYEAPPGIKLIIQISNRIHYVYGSMLYILIADKKNTHQILLVILLMFCAYLRAGLGTFICLGLTYLLKYYNEILIFIKKRVVFVMCLLIAFPIAVSYLYKLRDSLRSEISIVENLSTSQLICGKLVGRLSSFSNSAMVLQEKEYFSSNVRNLNNYYYEQQAVAGVFGARLMPQTRPESLLINVHGGNAKHSSFMVGIPGNCYIANLKSPWILLINIVFTTLMIIGVFAIMAHIKAPFSAEFALVLLLYPLTSGVASEFAQLIFFLFVFFIIFLVIRRIYVHS